MKKVKIEMHNKKKNRMMKNSLKARTKKLLKSKKCENIHL